MKKRIFIVSLVSLLIPGMIGFAQDKSYKDSLRQQFLNSKNSYQREFEGFKNQNDSLFLSYLNQSWKEFKVFKQDRKPHPKPVLQPMAPKVIENLELPKPSQIIEIQDRDSIGVQPGEQPPSLNNLENISTEIEYFDFLGQKVGISKSGYKPIVATDTRARIIKFFQTYAKSERLNKITRELFIISQAKQLNDWGFFYLLRIASASVFKDLNDQVLFTWASLQKCGFDVKIAYNKEDIFLLAEFKEKLFNTFYITISGKNYDLLNFPTQTSIAEGVQSYEPDYPGQVKPLSVFLVMLPRFANNPEYKKLHFEKDTITVALNINLIDFLKDYPACELVVYFNTPVSQHAMESFDRILVPLFSGKSEKEKVAILLNMMHESFPYKPDQEQFGREDYLFPDEALFYPFTDCEDRAVLFSQLISHYTTMTPIGLEYPDHVSIAVKFNEQIMGDYIILNNDKYYICDPTYLGSEIGMAMDSMKKSKSIIIPVMKSTR